MKILAIFQGLEHYHPTVKTSSVAAFPMPITSASLELKPASRNSSVVGKPISRLPGPTSLPRNQSPQSTHSVLSHTATLSSLQSEVLSFYLEIPQSGLRPAYSKHWVSAFHHWTSVPSTAKHLSQETREKQKNPLENLRKQKARNWLMLNL